MIVVLTWALIVGSFVSTAISLKTGDQLAATIAIVLSSMAITLSVYNFIQIL